MKKLSLLIAGLICILSISAQKKLPNKSEVMKVMASVADWQCDQKIEA